MNKKSEENLEKRVELLEKDISCKNLEKKVKTLENELKHIKAVLQYQIRNKVQ
tara:strand:- start:36 stop:194 length:159 start_codon:yes stop_codon:yes gene_type:complete